MTPAPPHRLALQTGHLDDPRSPITPLDERWDSAHALFLERDAADHLAPAARHDPRMDALCASWPGSPGAAQAVEALAVAVALAAPFAREERILAALASGSAEPADLRRLLASAPDVTSDAPRPRLPRVYDPDAEERVPIVPMLDGPPDPMVAAHLDTIKERDRNLADAIVLGADPEMLDLLERLDLDARRASRVELAEMIEHDRRQWRERAEAVRARQRLEGVHYHWCSDNMPPGCLEATRADIHHDANSTP